MTSRGLVRGAVGNWRNYPAQLRSLTVGGGSTQPVSSDSSGARYTEIPGGIVVAQFQYQFLVGSVGTGDVYAVRLPRPADRQSYPFVEGTGYVYTPFATFQDNIPVVPRLFDRGTFVELEPGDEDNWIGFQHPYYLEAGTGTLTGGGGASLAVSHSCPWTPTASELNITPTSLATTSTQNFPWSVTTTSSNFTVSMRAGTAVDVTFGWKMRAYPRNGGVHAYVGPKKPWLWGPLSTLFVQFYYAAR